MPDIFKYFVNEMYQAILELKTLVTSQILQKHMKLGLQPKYRNSICVNMFKQQNTLTNDYQAWNDWVGTMPLTS